MSGRVLPNLGLSAFYNLGESGWADAVAHNFLKLSVLAQGGVIGVANPLPTNPNQGDTYIVASNATNNANNVAVFDNGAWVYFAPNQGWILYNLAINQYSTYVNSVWTSIDLSAATSAATATATAQASLATTQASFSATSAATATAQAAIAQAAILGLPYFAILNASTAAGGSNILPQGIVSGTIAGTAITGATIGQYPLTPSGGSFTGVTANLVVTSAIAATIVVTSQGRTTVASPTAPTWANPAGANIPAGTTLTPNIGNIIGNGTGQYYLTSDATGSNLLYWQNTGTSAPVAVNSATGVQLSYPLSSVIGVVAKPYALDFGATPPIMDYTNAFGGGQGVYYPASIVLTRNGTTIIQTVTNATSSVLPGYVFFSGPGNLTRTYLWYDIDTNTYYMAAPDTVANMPTKSLDKIIQLLSVYGTSVVTYGIEYRRAEKNGSLIWIQPSVYEPSLNSLLMSGYYRRGENTAVAWTLVTPPVPVGFTVAPPYFQMGFSPTLIQNFWHDERLRLQTAVGGPGSISGTAFTATAAPTDGNGRASAWQVNHYLTGTGVPAGTYITGGTYPNYTVNTTTGSTGAITVSSPGIVSGGVYTFIKTSSGAGFPSNPDWLGTLLGKALNYSFQMESGGVVVGDVPGGCAQNQFSYGKDLTTSPNLRLYNTAQIVPVSQANINSLGVINGLFDATSNIPYCNVDLPVAPRTGRCFVRVWVVAAVANAFGSFIAAGIYDKGEANSFTLGHLTLEKQVTTTCAVFSGSFPYNVGFDPDHIRIGSNDTTVSVTVCAPQFAIDPNAFWIRWSDYPDVPQDHEVLASLQATFGAPSTVAVYGLPFSVPQSTTDIYINGDSLASISQGFAQNVINAYPGRSVSAQAISGQRSEQILMRMGKPGVCIVPNNTIPSGNAAITLTGVLPNPFAGAPSNPQSFQARLNGIPGILFWNGSSISFTPSGNTTQAIPVQTLCPLQIVSTKGTTTGATDTVLLRTVLNRLGIFRAGHNDLYTTLLAGSGPLYGYSREATKANILQIVNRLQAAAPRAIVFGISKSGAWLTNARIQGLGWSGFTGTVKTDAQTVAACIEADAINQWMADTFPGFIDPNIVAINASASYVTSVTFPNGYTTNFYNPTYAPDGLIHGDPAGLMEAAECAAIQAIISANGW